MDVADEWFYAQGDQQRGPVTADELRGMVSSGRVGPDDLVWREGLDNWRPAREVAELAGGPAAAAPPAGEPPREPVMIAPAQPALGQPPRPAQQLYASPAVAPSVLSYNAPSMEGVALTSQGMEMLRATRPWARLVAVMLYVVAGLMIVAGVVIGLLGMSRGSAEGVLSIIYVAFAIFYIVPAMYLNRYASGIGTLLANRRSGDLTDALAAQKSFWKFVGIFLLVVIVIYGVIAVIALVGVTLL